MKQVVENMKTGLVSVKDIAVPASGPNDVLVRNAASLISAGTERLLIEMGKKNLLGKARARPDLVRQAYDKGKREGFLNVFREAMARLDEPLPLGYSSAGVVIAAGELVQNFRVGDSVACAGFGYASHSEIISVPQDSCVKLQKGGEEPIPFEHASFVMLGGIAMHGIRTSQILPGERVVVVGLGLIGLLTVQIARSYGCTTIGIDVDEERVRLAQTLGCQYGLVINKDDVEDSVENITGGDLVDAVLVTAASKDNSPLQLAERVVRKRGRIVLVGVADISLTRKAFWDKEITFSVSKAAGQHMEDGASPRDLPIDVSRWSERRNLEEFVRLQTEGLVDVSNLITHRFSIADAEHAYEMILTGKEKFIGVVLTYPKDTALNRSVEISASTSHSKQTPKENRLAIGLIGAGMFTKNFLLPALKQVKDVEFIGVAARTGVNSQHVGERFGFKYATTDIDEIMLDDRIGSVVITTRHDSHASLVVQAIQAGKNVFVEKPMAITAEGVGSILEAYQASSFKPIMFTGFNRRHSPLATTLRDWYEERTSPMVIQYRINAGFIPPDHWTQDRQVGGGRIIGEVCHFVDFLQFVIGSDPLDVFSRSINGDSGKYLKDDNVVMSIQFADGSVGSILYSALGSKSFSRERVEVFCNDSVAVLDDFRELQLIRGTKRKRIRLRNQDLGYVHELNAFFSSKSTQKQLVCDALTTFTTFSLVESLKGSVPVAVPRIGQ